MNDNCLKRADNIVHGDRNETYGDPKQNHETTASLFSEFMRRRYGTFPELTAEDVCWFNLCQKMSREAHCKTDDGLTDICGYTANIEILRKGWAISEGKAIPNGNTEGDPKSVFIDEPAKEAAIIPNGNIHRDPCVWCGKRDHWASECKRNQSQPINIKSGPTHEHRESTR